jgi:hypothetical protein
MILEGGGRSVASLRAGMHPPLKSSGVNPYKKCTLPDIIERQRVNSHSDLCSSPCSSISRVLIKEEMNMKKTGYLVAVWVVVLALGFSFKAEAGSKESEVQKGNKFEDDSVVSIKESMEYQQEKESMFRKELIESNRETVGLLKDIKNILKEMKESAGKAAAVETADEAQGGY